MQKINSVVEAQEQLRRLNTEIAERNHYYLQQEAQISELVEAGNMQLMGLTHDIAVAKQELRSLKTDIRTAAQDKVLLNQDLDQIRSEIQITVVGVVPTFG